MNSTTTIAEFIERHEITMGAEPADENPHMQDMPRGSSHWLCTIARGDESMHVYYSMGPAHTSAPEAEDVIGCIADDIAGVENTPDWLDWAEEFGFAEGGASALRRARAAHDTIRVQGIELRALLGDEAFETLLWDVERQ